eukprot:scaffold231372_cov17-Tisochrysis_lutea.AAC.1
MVAVLSFALWHGTPAWPSVGQYLFCITTEFILRVTCAFCSALLPTLILIAAGHAHFSSVLSPSIILTAVYMCLLSVLPPSVIPTEGYMNFFPVLSSSFMLTASYMSIPHAP